MQVLDRAYARIGGKSWWSTVSGRARLQRMLKHHRAGAGAVRVTDLKAKAIHGIALSLFGVQTMQFMLKHPNFCQEMLKNLTSGGCCAERNLQGPKQLWFVHKDPPQLGKVSSLPVGG